MDKIFYLNKPIVRKEEPDCSKIDAELIDEKFVLVETKNKIIVEPIYHKMKYENALDKIYVRESVLEHLEMASNYLPDDIFLKVLDGYREYSFQEYLFNRYKEDIIKEFNLEEKDEEEKNKTISQYVSYPEKDSSLAPAHITGGAVDVTLSDKDGKELDMGVEFDAFSDKASTDYYENNFIDEAVKRNRRILFNAMTLAGFTSLPTEIWHYDLGDKNWAFYREKQVVYGGVFKKDELELLGDKKDE